MSQQALAGQVLEFTLGDDVYCVEIDRVSEILSNDHDVRELPNSPAHIEGVTNLRGETARIVNPQTLLGIEDEGTRNNVVVFDTDDQEDDALVGWLVDEVHEVSPVVEADVDTSVDQDHIVGIVKRDDLLVWLDPGEINP